MILIDIRVQKSEMSFFCYILFSVPYIATEYFMDFFLLKYIFLHFPFTGFKINLQLELQAPQENQTITGL